ncbi:translesion error-prone DNA polymerase V subunit UmuC [Nitrincola alkalilacustris]|uniref:translesion error-prone DNA polymerase V subunit UmuC n=1 Tax=Nitrincola alkalilacustris TaxID=1571224 RepID=UPI00124D7451|nr:translesion error-prone DNA polymerase V subunit UmuC [Nitrincola alkalilacustris]
MTPVFALVDCNNFYASCEKLFRPDLKHRPVVVLSNNDGCIIARSAEAKALGVPMGAPLFQVQQLIRQHQIVVFSSNYPLYGDISARVMQVLEELAPRVEVYSIDEAFLDLTGVRNCLSLQDFGLQIRDTLQRWLGISVSVGMAPSKTLAKLANQAAKRYPATGGIVDLSCTTRQKKLMSLMSVGDVWGVGRRLSKHLEAMGIDSALKLAQTDPRMMRKRFSVTLERTINELNGIPCFGLDESPATKQQILCSRSFGERITTLQPMREAIATYAGRAAEKLRLEQRYARRIGIFIRTSSFTPGQPFYAQSASLELDLPSDDTRILLDSCMKLLDQIWRDGYDYAKAGVMLGDFFAPGTYQPDLFKSKSTLPANSKALMTVLDRINLSGRGRIHFARQGCQQPWRMKQEHRSPAYTTRWTDLPGVR